MKEAVNKQKGQLTKPAHLSMPTLSLQGREACCALLGLLLTLPFAVTFLQLEPFPKHPLKLLGSRRPRQRLFGFVPFA
jgi:hypothetical protein